MATTTTTEISYNKFNIPSSSSVKNQGNRYLLQAVLEQERNAPRAPGMPEETKRPPDEYLAIPGTYILI